MLAELEYRLAKKIRQCEFANEDPIYNKARSAFVVLTALRCKEMVQEIRMPGGDRETRRDNAVAFLKAAADFSTGLPRHVYEDAIRGIDDAYRQ